MPKASRRSNRRSSSSAAPAAAETDVLIVTIEDDAQTASTSTSGGAAPRTVVLPRELPGYPYREVSEAAIAAIEGEIGDMPVVFFQAFTREMGDSLLLATNGLITRTSITGPIPREVEITLPDTLDVSDTPTHVLAICASTPADQTVPITLYPVHAPVLVAHCANLALPPGGVRPLVLEAHSPNLPLPPAGIRRLALPVHAIRLPSPPTFHHVLQYVYTGRPEPLLMALLPLSGGMSSEAPHAYRMRAVETHTLPELLEFAYTVQGVWDNVGTLGVCDDTVSEVVWCAWVMLLKILEMKMEAQ